MNATRFTYVWERADVTHRSRSNKPMDIPPPIKNMLFGIQKLRLSPICRTSYATTVRIPAPSIQTFPWLSPSRERTRTRTVRAGGPGDRIASARRILL